jgi:hypothetical protein
VPRRRHRVLRDLGVLLLAALLLAPVVLSGHSHADDPAASRTCGTCIAVRHSPVLEAVAPAALAPSVVVVTIAVAIESPAPVRARARAAGRSPPAHRSTALA